MPSLIFNTCCGCVELKKGCLILGYLELVCEILFMALGMIAIVAGEAATHEVAEDQKMGKAILIVTVLAILLSIPFTIVLLIGLHEDKRNHVKVYLIFAAIVLVITLISNLAAAIISANAFDIVKNFFSYILDVYFVLVIRSYYYKMKEIKPVVYNAV